MRSPGSGAGHEAVERGVVEHARIGDGRQPLDGGPRDGGDRVGVAGDDRARGLAVGDERQRGRERGVGGRAQAVRGARAVLAREHQLEQRRVLGGEGDVGVGERAQAGFEGGAGLGEGDAQVAAEALEAVLGERVEQRLLVREVPAWRRVADADLARELAQRELPGAVLAQRPLGAREQGGPQVAVVIGAGTRGHLSRS